MKNKKTDLEKKQAELLHEAHHPSAKYKLGDTVWKVDEKESLRIINVIRKYFFGLSNYSTPSYELLSQDKRVIDANQNELFLDPKDPEFLFTKIRMLENKIEELSKKKSWFK